MRLAQNISSKLCSNLKMLGRSFSRVSECSVLPDSDESNGSCNLKSSRRKFTIAVEGNIGCGKSTFLDYMRRHSFVEVCDEPVPEWQNLNGRNVLSLMYEDAARWGLAFQSYVQLTMLKLHNSPQTATVRMIERSVHSARYCFIENLHKEAHMAGVDYAILCDWYDHICANYHVDVDMIVYLRSSPAVCHARMVKRGRAGEDLVTLSYLQSLHDLHEEWLVRRAYPACTPPVLTFDTCKPLEQLLDDYDRRWTELLCGCAREMTKEAHSGAPDMQSSLAARNDELAIGVKKRLEVPANASHVSTALSVCSIEADKENIAPVETNVAAPVETNVHIKLTVGDRPAPLEPLALAVPPIAVAPAQAQRTLTAHKFKPTLDSDEAESLRVASA